MQLHSIHLAAQTPAINFLARIRAIESWIQHDHKIFGLLVLTDASIGPYQVPKHQLELTTRPIVVRG